MARPRGGKYRPTQFEPVPYPLSGGVDTKFHGLVLPPPKLQVCKNAYADQTGSLQRRFGRSLLTSNIQGGATVGTLTALSTYKNNLLGFTMGDPNVPGAAYEYSQTEAKWVAKGDVESPRVRSENIAKSGAEAGALQGDSSTANGVTVHAYVEQEPSGANLQSSVRITVIDANGTVLKKAYTLYATTTASADRVIGVRCVARANLVYVFWYDPDLTDLRVAILDATSSSSLGTMEPTPVTVTGDIGPTSPHFDVASNSTYGIFVAWNDTTASQLSFGFVDTSGALVNTSTTAAVSDFIVDGFISVAVATGNAMHGIAYVVGTQPNDVYALHRSFNGTAWSVTATSGALDTAVPGGTLVRNLGCSYSGGSVLRLVYTIADTANPTVYQAQYSTAGAASSRIGTLRHSWLASKPRLGLDDTKFYFWVVANSGASNAATRVLFLMRQDGVVVAKALDVQGAFKVYNTPVSLPRIEASLAAGATRFGVTVPYLTGALASVGFQSQVLGLRRVLVDMVHEDSHEAVEAAGESLHMAGGYLQMYDGESFVEAAIMLPLDTGSVADPAQATIAGTHLTATAIYAYHFIYAWSDLRGQRVLGTNLGVKTCPVLTGTNNQHTFTLPTLAHTRMLAPRGDAVILVYRTLANPTADSPHYYIGQVTNDPTASTVTFVDTVADTAAATSETFYQDTGELENTAPPTGYLLAAGNGRVFVAGIADLPNTVVPSKIRTDGRVLEFSDFLPRIVVPDAGGPITALAVLNETLVIFKKSAIYRVRGDGPNNLGFGDWLTPELVSADTGTAIARSVVVTPMGVMFEGVKGKMLLTQAYTLAYVGAPLEKLSAPGTCKGAVLVPALQQVRFSYAATTHVYDYYHQQWYVFTHGSDGATCRWNDVHTALDTGVVYDDAAVWTDAGDPYTMEITLGWVTSPRTRRGDLQVRQVALTGESLAAHNLAIFVAYDQGAPVGLIEQSIAGAGVLEPLWRVSRQYCSSIEVTIRDALLDVYGADVVVASAGMRLVELAFELGLRSTMLGRDI